MVYAQNKSVGIVMDAVATIMPTTDKNNSTSFEDMFQVIGWVALAIGCGLFLMVMAWLYQNQRDVFLFIASIMMAIASIMILAVIIHEKDRMEMIPFKMSLVLSSLLAIVNLANFALFLSRFLQVNRQKRELMQMPGLPLPRTEGSF